MCGAQGIDVAVREDSAHHIILAADDWQPLVRHAPDKLMYFSRLIFCVIALEYPVIQMMFLWAIFLLRQDHVLHRDHVDHNSLTAIRKFPVPQNIREKYDRCTNLDWDFNIVPMAVLGPRFEVGMVICFVSTLPVFMELVPIFLNTAPPIVVHARIIVLCAGYLIELEAITDVYLLAGREYTRVVHFCSLVMAPKQIVLDVCQWNADTEFVEYSCEVRVLLPMYLVQLDRTKPELLPVWCCERPPILIVAQTMLKTIPLSGRLVGRPRPHRRLHLLSTFQTRLEGFTGGS